MQYTVATPVQVLFLKSTFPLEPFTFSLSLSPTHTCFPPPSNKQHYSGVPLNDPHFAYRHRRRRRPRQQTKLATFKTLLTTHRRARIVGGKCPPVPPFFNLFYSIVVVSIDSTLSNDRARQSIKYAVMNACIDSTPFLWNFGFPKLFRTIWKGEGASINHVIVFTNQIS